MIIITSLYLAISVSWNWRCLSKWDSRGVEVIAPGWMYYIFLVIWPPLKGWSMKRLGHHQRYVFERLFEVTKAQVDSPDSRLALEKSEQKGFIILGGDFQTFITKTKELEEALLTPFILGGFCAREMWSSQIIAVIMSPWFHSHHKEMPSCMMYEWWYRPQQRRDPDLWQISTQQQNERPTCPSMNGWRVPGARLQQQVPLFLQRLAGNGSSGKKSNSITSIPRRTETDTMKEISSWNDELPRQETLTKALF